MFAWPVAIEYITAKVLWKLGSKEKGEVHGDSRSLQGQPPNTYGSSTDGVTGDQSLVYGLWGDIKSKAQQFPADSAWAPGGRSRSDSELWMLFIPLFRDCSLIQPHPSRSGAEGTVRAPSERLSVANPRRQQTRYHAHVQDGFWWDCLPQLHPPVSPHWLGK